MKKIKEKLSYQNVSLGLLGALVRGYLAHCDYGYKTGKCGEEFSAHTQINCPKLL